MPNSPQASACEGAPSVPEGTANAAGCMAADGHAGDSEVTPVQDAHAVDVVDVTDAAAAAVAAAVAAAAAAAVEVAVEAAVAGGARPVVDVAVAVAAAIVAVATVAPATVDVQDVGVAAVVAAEDAVAAAEAAAAAVEAAAMGAATVAVAAEDAVVKVAPVVVAAGVAAAAAVAVVAVAVGAVAEAAAAVGAVVVGDAVLVGDVVDATDVVDVVVDAVEAAARITWAADSHVACQTWAWRAWAGFLVGLSTSCPCTVPMSCAMSGAGGYGKAGGRRMEIDEGQLQRQHLQLLRLLPQAPVGDVNFEDDEEQDSSPSKEPSAPAEPAGQHWHAKQEKIYLPTLKFIVKEDKAKTLEGIKPTVRYGLKVVRILHQSPSDKKSKTLRCIDFPGKCEQLNQGDECWVLPLLEDDVEISVRDDCQKRIDEAFRHLYDAWQNATPDQHNERKKEGCCTAGKLAHFAKEFSKDGLVLDWLPLRLEKYDADAPAAICTDKVAEKLLEYVNGLEKEQEESVFTARRPEYLEWFQAATASGEELKVQLRYMNMRNKYNISPVGVIHGGSGLQGSWEIPERWTTVCGE
ncbi:unnamed protein product [Symbiodinium microadriaticum]|nr:unnamed protein product [Symbiodinium microadriaticum]